MKKKCIALVAHDGTPKQEICKFINYGENKEVLKQFRLVGTSATAKMIKEICGVEVESMGHGPDFGDIRLANLIVNSEVDFLFFFNNKEKLQPHWHDIQMLINCAIKKNIPLYLNKASADLAIQAIGSIE